MGKRKFIAGFLCFLAYSFLGWCYEVFLETVVYRWGFSNRGFLWGPYLPVYGVGVLLLLTCLRGWSRRKLLIGRLNLMPVEVFLAVVILTTAVELAASYILEWKTGGWLWDYTRYTYQWQGRICLSASMRFGLGGMVILYGLQPLLERGLIWLGENRQKMLYMILMPLFCLDLVIHVWMV